jgi:hypothetical protein
VLDLPRRVLALAPRVLPRFVPFVVHRSFDLARLWFAFG